MTHDELIERGKMIFNFHPDTAITSSEQLLEVARRMLRHHGAYECGVALYAEALAKFADEHK